MDYQGEKVFLKMKKHVIIMLAFFCVMISGCGNQNTDVGHSWIPEETETKEEIAVETSKEENGDVSSEKLYPAKKLVNTLLGDNGRTAADILWENQKATGIYEYDKEQIEQGKLLVYYISSSEGSDENDGLSPEKPKKSLDAFAGISNINLLLKCGDTFQMSSTFSLGSNVVLAPYGEGARPILDFYQPLLVRWKKVKAYANVWKADLKEVEGLADTNCNVGQLLINGQCNWKRKIKQSGDDYAYGEYLAQVADGSFMLDEGNSILYLYTESNPNNENIAYALPAHGLSMNNIRGSRVLGMEITGAGFHGISLCNVVDVQIKNCYIHHIGGGLLSNTGPRYGNAVELWDGGQDVLVSHNMADWIFDTCYTNQGSNSKAVQKDVTFSYNIGRFSFWGIETWGDGYAEQPFERIVYDGNILMNACDVTAPTEAAFCDREEKLINNNGEYIETPEPYNSYRGSGYNYHQMSLLNATDNRNKGELKVVNNVFWGTKRFLCMLGKSEEGKKFLLPENNLFYGEIPSSNVCLYRTTEVDGTRKFMQKLPLGTAQNTLITYEAANGKDFETAKKILKETVEKISKGNKQE